jgi:hypothetical protein
VELTHLSPSLPPPSLTQARWASSSSSSTTSSIVDPLLYGKSSLLDEKHAVLELELERAEGARAKERLELLREEMEKSGVEA